MTALAVETGRIQVAIVEDDDEIRSNLSHQINRSSAFRLLRSYSDAESALNDLPKLKPDVVLMDINLPGMDGVECVRQLKSKMPSVQFVMLTVYEDSNRLFKSLMAGASGYLLKRTPREKLLDSIQEVCKGGAPMSPEIARRVVQHFQQTQPALATIPASASAIPNGGDGLPDLSPRERDVLDQLAKGFRYKEIVDNLGISTGTLHSYISNIYEKLHVHSRTEAVVKYLQH